VPASEYDGLREEVSVYSEEFYPFFHERHTKVDIDLLWQFGFFVVSYQNTTPSVSCGKMEGWIYCYEGRQ
jgi:hypothetical protein